MKHSMYYPQLTRHASRSMTCVAWNLPAPLDEHDVSKPSFCGSVYCREPRAEYVFTHYLAIM